MKYKIGDKIPASQWDKEEYGLEWVTITSINKERRVYHWEAPWGTGKIHSGYYFHEVDKK